MFCDSAAPGFCLFLSLSLVHCRVGACRGRGRCCLGLLLLVGVKGRGVHGGGDGGSGGADSGAGFGCFFVRAECCAV